ncbi:MAG: glutaredoxin family protein [Polyangiaceae bacterium]|nr:glutaredoxin family protein [Polyangiaceae bacterium]
MRRLTFYTRERCGLCHEALAIVERVRAAHPCVLEVKDLDRDAPADKRAAYDHEVPVLELDGQKVMKLRFDEARLLRLLG